MQKSEDEKKGNKDGEECEKNKKVEERHRKEETNYANIKELRKRVMQCR